MALSSCAEDGPTAVETSIEPAVALAEEARVRQAAGERDVVPRMFAERLEGYGGHFVEDGKLKVFLRDLTRRGQVAPIVRALRASVGPAADLPVEVLPADYSFQDLDRWRADLAPHIWAIDGVRLLGVSKRLNRLVIGVEPFNTSAVRRSIAVADIPSGAVRVLPVAPELEDCEETQALEDCEPGGGGGPGGTPGASTDSLRTTSPFGVIEAGRQIWTTHQPYSSAQVPCTAGPIGQGKPGTVYSGRYYMLIAGHCTSEVDWNGRTNFLHPDANGTYLGREEYAAARTFSFADPSGMGCNLFGGAYGCLHGEAALVEVVGMTPGKGRIARPAGNPATRSAGTLAISASQPFFHVDQEHWLTYRLNPGEDVHKVGRTTGWTHGDIYDACWDYRMDASPSTSVVVMCTNIAWYYSWGGDSGAPVFQRLTDNSVRIVGLHIGGAYLGQDKVGVYASSVGIQTDAAYLWSSDDPSYSIDWSY